jgi:zinc D-Ala-D-Ala carboxypeptidase
MNKRIVGTLAALAVLLAGGVVTATDASARSYGACTYTSAEPALYQGDSGTAVKQLQCELNLSLSSSTHVPLNVDGSFGGLTEAAVLNFQQCANIHVDGQVGPQTWGSLDYWFASPNYVC